MGKMKQIDKGKKSKIEWQRDKKNETERQRKEKKSKIEWQRDEKNETD